MEVIIREDFYLLSLTCILSDVTDADSHLVLRLNSADYRLFF
jgi:hypothetical protein